MTARRSCSGGVTFDEDRHGFTVARCACGAKSMPVPSTEDAADWYGDHRAAVERANFEALATGLRKALDKALAPFVGIGR